MSTGRCSPEPSRECSSMFLTIESARLPCCTILLEIVAQCIRQFGDFCARLIVGLHALQGLPAIRRCSSTETLEKLLTKLSGFLISWAMPAVSWPSEASFCV